MTVTMKILLVLLLVTSTIASYPAHHHLFAKPGHGLSARGNDLLARQGCSASEAPCGSGCIPSDGVCCPDGNYCEPGWLCWPQVSGCCKPGYIVCGIGCMPPGSACCDEEGDYCDAGDHCIVVSGGKGKCCPTTTTCNGQISVTTFAAGTVITGSPSSTTFPGFSSSSAPLLTGSPSSTTLPGFSSSSAPLLTATLPSASIQPVPSTSLPSEPFSSLQPATSVLTVEQTSSPAFTEFGTPTSSAGGTFTGAAVGPTPVGSEIFAMFALAIGHFLL